jgi:hypothetical protein
LVARLARHPQVRYERALAAGDARVGPLRVGAGGDAGDPTEAGLHWPSDTGWGLAR